MWNVFGLLTVVLVGASYQSALVHHSPAGTNGIRADAIGSTAHADHAGKRQDAAVKDEEPTVSVSKDRQGPSIAPKAATECPPCTCGARGVEGRIVGGTPTDVNQYPWMAVLFNNSLTTCGATLINDRYVMTAAHCVHGIKKENISISLMEHDLSSTDESNTVNFKISKVIEHSEYDIVLTNNDVALLRLETSVKLGQETGIYPVCLPPKGKSFAGETGIVTGWGLLEQSGNSISMLLREVSVPILSNEECKKTALGPELIMDTMMCAGIPEGGKDSCQGDSGGPLHVNIGSAYYIAGVVSWGDGCALPDLPGVYARVTEFLDWVTENTKDACPCSGPYVPPKNAA